MYIAEGRYDFMNTKASSDFNHKQTDEWQSRALLWVKWLLNLNQTVDLSLKIVLFVFLSAMFYTFCRVSVSKKSIKREH